MHSQQRSVSIESMKSSNTAATIPSAVVRTCCLDFVEDVTASTKSRPRGQFRAAVPGTELRGIVRRTRYSSTGTGILNQRSRGPRCDTIPLAGTIFRRLFVCEIIFVITLLRMIPRT